MSDAKQQLLLEAFNAAGSGHPHGSHLGRCLQLQLCSPGAELVGLGGKGEGRLSVGPHESEEGQSSCEAALEIAALGTAVGAGPFVPLL